MDDAFFKDKRLRTLVIMNVLVIALRSNPPLFNAKYDSQLSELHRLGETIGIRHPNLNQLVMHEPTTK